MLDSLRALIACEPARTSSGDVSLGNQTRRDARKERTRVIELSSLTDTEPSRTDDHHTLHIRLLDLGKHLGRDLTSELGRRVESRLALSFVVVSDGRSGHRFKRVGGSSERSERSGGEGTSCQRGSSTRESGKGTDSSKHFGFWLMKVEG